MTQLIIGINGLARHGKDTVASMLHTYLACNNVDSVILRYAHPIKEIAKYVFDLTDDDVESTEGKNRTYPQAYGLTSRQIQQRLGTECFRDIFSPNIWLDWMDRRIAKNLDIPVYIKPDMRFDNELKHTDDQGEKFRCHTLKINVFNPNVICPPSTHVSEKVHPPVLFDHVFINGGSLADLQAQVEQWAEEEVLPLLRIPYE